MTNEQCICNHGDVENTCFPLTRCACKVHGKFNTMTNDLKNFLEGEELSLREEVFIKEIGRTRAEVKSVLTKAQGKLTEEFISDFCVYLSSRENETTDWLQYHDTRLINFVLDLVEKKLPEIEKRKENVLLSSNIQDHLDDAITAGKERYRHEVSTIVNKLRV